MFHLVEFVKYWEFFLELNSKRLHQSSRKETGTRKRPISGFVDPLITRTLCGDYHKISCISVALISGNNYCSSTEQFLGEISGQTLQPFDTLQSIQFTIPIQLPFRIYSLT